MYILSSGYSIPKQCKNIHEISSELSIPHSEKIILNRFFGLENFPIDAKVNINDLIIQAVTDCVINKCDLKKIKWCIHAHTANPITPFGENVMRNTMQKLNIDHARYFGMNFHKCASIFNAFMIANEIMASLADDETILVVSGDITFTRILQYIPGTTITTDGAAAILLAKKHKDYQYLGCVLQSHGEFAKGIWDDKNNLQQFEKCYTENLVSVIQKLLQQANLKSSHIRLIFPHNVNIISWKQVIHKLNMSAEQVYLQNVKRISHSFGSDPFINFHDSISQHLLKKSDYFIFATVGLGAAFAAMLFQY